MVNKFRHSALILLGVFLYPMLYQTIHNMHFHTHEANAPLGEPKGPALTAHEAPCVVFSYEFTYSDLPASALETTPVYFLTQNIIPKLTIVYPRFTGTHKYLRAPPVTA